ncbi:hypothetical protein NRIC_04700 [Enterococcus florum]|uniref:Uncharacterized protein n=1 Tax=Enterococcus florum TaxID=2480627 RepID=A0A4V0WP45_9ENTE|nr:hypothetical protein [Enterococcus florum]GCF92579.1 hypothetical protein NRIC_04700 [Enterococcus florum]
METIMLAAEEIFLDTTDHDPCMTADCRKLMAYSNQRNLKTAIVAFNDSTVFDTDQEEIPVFKLNDEKELEELLRQPTFDRSTKYFLDHSRKRLKKAAEYGFTPVLIDQNIHIEKPDFECLAFHSLSDFHLALIQEKFENHLRV